MLFSTPVFLFCFLPVTLIGYYIMSNERKNFILKNTFLTFCSLFFYAWGEPRFVLIMIGSILMNWAFALWIDNERQNNSLSKFIIVIMLLANLGIFFIYKYLVFTITTINEFLNKGYSVPSITLPIGISFFTFQAISYVIDVYRKKGQAQANPMNVAFYISFFPQLIAGPIVRYETVAFEIKNRHFDLVDFSIGVKRFIIGLSKKAIIANTVAILADRAFNVDDLSGTSVLMAWLGAISYALQIYFDFSGYSDMAIGLGLMFGFHFLENFNYPYIAKSITEFWRRWHISLGTWFRDYVYFPLGGSHVKSKVRLIFNLFVVWLLTGIWHGANWTFLLWGVMYFTLISVEKIISFFTKHNKTVNQPTIIGQKTLGTYFKNIVLYLYTMFFVIIGWVLFRSDSIAMALVYIRCMFGLNGNAASDLYTDMLLRQFGIILTIGIFFCFPIIKTIHTKLEKIEKLTFLIEIIDKLVVLALFVLAVSFVVGNTYNPFIYFNF